MQQLIYNDKSSLSAKDEHKNIDLITADSNQKSNLNNLVDTDTIYVLPKVYNGKTVTDLFPEFKYNSVLRFSKLFGVGRTSSLPKTWKGTRKRKKQKQTSDLSTNMQTINNLTHNESLTANKSSLELNHESVNQKIHQNAADDDVFKLFEVSYSPKTVNKEDVFLEKTESTAITENKELLKFTNTEEKNNTDINESILLINNEEEIKEKKDSGKDIVISSKQFEDKAQESLEKLKINDELEFETDDEINFMKPFLIDDLKSAKSPTNNDSNIKDGESSIISKSSFLTSLYAPASYWYQKEELFTQINLKAKKENEDKLSKENEDDEENEEYDEKNDNELIDLRRTVENLKDKIKDNAFLLVNSIDWEQDIIIDSVQNHMNSKLNNQQRSSSLVTSNNMRSERIKFAGWIPSSEHRTLTSFQSKILGKKVDHLNSYKDQFVPSNSSKHHHQQIQANITPNWSSIFPNENYELINGNWEDKIIIDPKKNYKSISKVPPEFCFDLNDDNMLLGGVSDDFKLTEEFTKNAFLNQINGENMADNASRKEYKLKTGEGHRGRLSKHSSAKNNLLSTDINEDNNEEKKAIDQSNNENVIKKSFWNISNDEYYSPKVIPESTTNSAATTAATTTVTSTKTSTAIVLQHTQAALELHSLFFPTHISTHRLRNFHRLPLKRYLNGALINESGFFNPTTSLLKKLNKKKENKFSLNSNLQINNNDFMPIRYANDLSLNDKCEVILAEYSEQYPPLMMQVGMATKIRNYYKRKFGKDDGPVNSLDYGEAVYVNQSPFLGSLKPGEFLQSLENYMFRAPIYKHKNPDQDFVIIRNRQSGFLIRGDIKNIFVVGQECPMIEVPGPNSKRANTFIKDFLQAFIFRLFHQSNEIPKRIRMEDIKKAFPLHAENSIRKRLKLCADLRRTGGKLDANWWILKDDVRLPNEEEIRSIVTPEQCCAYYSMLAAEQRLKDAGYGEKNLFANEDEDVDNMKIDDEVKNAPWHTTRAYLDAIKGKCLLQINGVADPTGRGEGFSYVRQPFKQNKQEEEANSNNNVSSQQQSLINDSVSSPQQTNNTTAAAKRTVTGTDADLRRLHLSQAKELLVKYGVPDHEIKKLKRWEIIDVVRTMSTQKAKEGGMNASAVSKFARGNKYSQSDAHDKFREECQRLFELQNRNLASEEYLSTDDDEELDQDSDLDEMGKNLESMLQNKMSTSTTTGNSNANLSNSNITDSKSASNKPMDSSSELKNLILSNQTEQKSDQQENINPNLRRVLKISRTFRDEETGQEFTKIEIVTKPLIIDAYVKIRSTKDDEFIRTAFALDETEKEKLRKERRKIQEQLRRFKRIEAKQLKSDGKDDPNNPVPKVRKYNKTGLNRKPKNPAKLTKKERLLLNSENANQISNKSGMDYSSNDDENKGQSLADQSNLANSSSNLNTSAASTTNPVVTKRKYIKRKKDGTNSEQLSKVEGTKLIIQKKAIKLALKNASQIENENLDGMSMDSSPAKKKRLTKKQQKLLELNNSSKDLMVVNDDTNASINSANENNMNTSSNVPTAPKIKIINKAKKQPIILHIPKDKITTSATNDLIDSSSSNSPAVIDITSVNDSNTYSPVLQQQQTPQQQNPPKRQYNKQNSLLKKQQKFLMQQQQQQQHLLQQQISQSPLASAAAAVAAASQIATFLEQQQLILALQQQQQLQQIMSPATASGNFTFQSNSLNKHAGNNLSQQHQQQQNSKRKLNLQNSAQLDYLVKPHKKVDRRHADPAVSLSTILENIIDELRALPDAQPFLLPVNSKKVPDYYNVIKNPIDMQTIRKRINDKYYKDRLTFLDDMQLLIDNSSLYNGPNHSITSSAEKLFEHCYNRLEEKKDKLLRLEKEINPLLDDNSLIAFNYLLGQIYEQNIITVENSFSFLKPVNKTKYKDYYDVVKNPIDLETIKNKIANKKYQSRSEFINDFELLYENCLQYNGSNNSYSNTAEKLLNACKDAIDDYREQMMHLEDMIFRAIQQNDDYDNSNQGHSRHVSTDILTDSESNAQTNFSNYQENESMDGMMTQSLVMSGLNPTKKQKAFSHTSKHQINSDNYNIINPKKNDIKKSKKFIFSSLKAPSNKNSPKSGSDAEVFVDVESIDDRESGLCTSGLALSSSMSLVNRHLYDNEEEDGTINYNNQYDPNEYE